MKLEKYRRQIFPDQQGTLGSNTRWASTSTLMQKEGGFYKWSGLIGQVRLEENYGDDENDNGEYVEHEDENVKLLLIDGFLLTKTSLVPSK